MKKLRILPLSFILILCSLSLGLADEKVAVDLVEYVNQGILNIGELETVALEKYSAVIGENYTSDEIVYNALKEDVIPLYKRFYEGLRLISPKTEEVIKLHQIYVRGAASINEGFRIKMLGLESQDDSVVIMANKKIEAGSEDVIEWKRQLQELCKAHGVGTKESKE
ncbi:MAG: hypothetical protein JW882_03370 [Deltaproteobacteria bacterium]|nr:hypothetical protein [Deltaproteobacteria bacterium]